MEAYTQNPLSFNANRISFELPPVFASVLRVVREHAAAWGAHATTIVKQMQLRLDALRRYLAIGNLALAGLWATLAVSDAEVRLPRESARAIEPRPMTGEEHWRRATGVLSGALASFQRVKSLQAAAARQLDSADYALTQLIHDLRPAMALPADVSGLRAILAEAERTAPQRYRKALAA